jgi:Ti-type conjugative transfer relaxase TraA
LKVAHCAWVAEGYTVKGAALSGIAAPNIQDGAAIPSRTLASLEHAWSQGRDLLGPRDILVIDEAGLVGSRQMQIVLDQVQKAGAKIVLVGDVQQLQAIEAGAAFRLIVQRHGAAEITEVRRQLQPWQAAATQALGDGRTELALAAYFAAGQVHAHDDGVRAQQALIDDWAADRSICPSRSQLILGCSREEVRSLNILARRSLKQEGLLGGDHYLRSVNGDHTFAVNDRVFFRRNSRDLDVKNGTSGTIAAIEGVVLTVNLDQGRVIRVDLRAYDDLDYGYATTIHRAQGVTVDRAYLLVD